MSTTRLDQLQEMLKDNPGDMFLHFAIAKEYESGGDLNAARLKYEFIFQESPEYIGNYYHLAKCYETLGELEKALETYNKGIEMGKSIGDFHAVSELNNAKMNLELDLDQD